MVCPVQKSFLVLVFTGLLIFDFAVVSTFFSVRNCFLQKRAHTSKVYDNGIELFLSHTCLLVFEKGYDEMKIFNYVSFQSTNMVGIQTNFCKHNQEHFQFLFQMGNFATMPGVGDVSCKFSLSSSLSRRIGFLLIFPFSDFQTLQEKMCINPWSVDNITSNWGFSQEISLSSKSDSSQLLVCIWYAPALKLSSSLI